MYRIAFVLLVLLAVIESPTAVFRCQLLAQEDHATDPCLFDGPMHTLAAHNHDLTPSYILDTTHSNLHTGISLLGIAAFALMYAIKGVTILPLIPPPRFA